MSDKDSEKDAARERSVSKDDTRDNGDRKESRAERESRTTGTTCSLLVRNLSYTIRAEEIKKIMNKYGDVRDVYIPTDYYTKRPRGFAFVEFYNKRDAADALDSLDRYELDGRELSIVFAKDRRKTPDEMRPARGGYQRHESRDRGRYGGGGGGDRGRRNNSRDRDYRAERSRSRDRGGGRDYGRSERGGGRDRSPPRYRADSPPPRRGDSPPPRRRSPARSDSGSPRDRA
eukprot:gene4978-6961_t